MKVKAFGVEYYIRINILFHVSKELVWVGLSSYLQNEIVVLPLIGFIFFSTNFFYAHLIKLMKHSEDNFLMDKLYLDHLLEF